MMMKNIWTKGFTVLGIGLLSASVAMAQEKKGIEINRMPGDIPGPIDSLHDVQDSLRMAFMAADQNHDGLLSQQEAIDAGNLMVGGMFFAADANGDAKVTKDEAAAIRKKVLQQNPILRFALQRAKNPNQKNLAGTEALNGVSELLDTDNDQTLSATEVRQAVQSAVKGAFAIADTNRDGQLSPTEMNSAVFAFARAAVDSAFQMADKDNNGSLSKDEFTQALVDPAHSAFDILDANLDGELTTQELERATRVLADQFNSLTIPEAKNSPERLIEQGRLPGEAAPTPNVTIPTTGRTPRP